MERGQLLIATWLPSVAHTDDIARIAAPHIAGLRGGVEFQVDNFKPLWDGRGEVCKVVCVVLDPSRL